VPTATPSSEEVLFTGTPFGSASAAINALAFDGLTTTSFVGANNGIVGIDLGEGNAKRLTKLRWCPNYTASQPWLADRCAGTIEGSKDGVTYSTITNIPSGGTTWVEQPITDLNAYRFFRLRGNQYFTTEIAELQFYGVTSATMPKVNLAAGRYESPIDVVLSCTTQDVQIYYTKDGSIPTKTSGIKYVSPIHIGQGESFIIKAIAVRVDLANSQMLLAGYGVGAYAPVSKGLRIYTIGNSLTDTIFANNLLTSVSQSVGYPHELLRWTIPGAALPWLNNNQTSGFGNTWVEAASCQTSTTFGAPYTEAFHYTAGIADQWFNPDTCTYTVDKYAPLDIITVQPFGNGDNIENGISLGKKYYDKARANNPNIRYMLYGS